MKKIIIVLLLLVCCTGCYDYDELSNMAIVVGMGMDFENNEYKLTYEILNDTEASESSGGSPASKSYVVTGSGKTIVEATQDINAKIAKRSYYMHLKVIVLGENITKNNLDKTVDYLLRSPKLSNEFLSIVAKDTTAYDIFNSEEDSPPIIADTLVKMLENDENTYNIATAYPFVDVLSKAFGNGSEMVISTVTKKDDELKLGGIAVFKNFELKGYLSNQDSITYNILDNNTKNSIYKDKCSDDEISYLSIAFYNSATKIKVVDNKANVSVNLSGSIVENNCGYDLLDESIYLDFEKEFSKIVKKDIQDLIQLSISYDSDFLSIGSAYYRSSRKEDANIFKNLDYEVEVSVLVNRKGLTYEVEQ